MKARLASGHNERLQAVPDWDFDLLDGAGALRSTANDLLKFLADNLELTDTPLTPAMRATQPARLPTGMPALETGIGRQILTQAGSRIVWHNGGTYGYTSFVGFDLKMRVGAVVLSNAFKASAANFGVDDIGLHLINADYPLAQIEPPKERKQIAVDLQVLKRYVGRYDLMPNFIITITREDTHLFAQATGQLKIKIYPESAKEFFYEVIEARISFKIGGRVALRGPFSISSGMSSQATVLSDRNQRLWRRASKPMAHLEFRASLAIDRLRIP